MLSGALETPLPQLNVYYAIKIQFLSANNSHMHKDYLMKIRFLWNDYSLNGTDM